MVVLFVKTAWRNFLRNFSPRFGDSMGSINWLSSWKPGKCWDGAAQKALDGNHHSKRGRTGAQGGGKVSLSEDMLNPGGKVIFVRIDVALESLRVNHVDGL